MTRLMAMCMHMGIVASLFSDVEFGIRICGLSKYFRVFCAVSRRPIVIFCEDTVNISSHRIALADKGGSDKVMAMGLWTDEKNRRRE
jgi:hypothetical protein